MFGNVSLSIAGKHPNFQDEIDLSCTNFFLFLQEDEVQICLIINSNPALAGNTFKMVEIMKQTN